LAEMFPAVVTTEAVGVYRYPTRHSGQGSSARAAQLRRVVRHQLELLKLPRAASATKKQRRMVRRRLRNRIADTSLWNAAQRLPYGEFDQVSENVLLAMQLSPTRAISSLGPRRILDAFAAKRRTAVN